MLLGIVNFKINYMDTAHLTKVEKQSIETFMTLTKDYAGLQYFFIPLAKIPHLLVKKVLVSCHLNKDKTLVYIQVKSLPENYEPDIVENCPTFEFSVTIKERLFLVFSIDTVALPDIELILQGRCTEISRESKVNIFVHSGLPYNKKGKEGICTTHYLLQALVEHNEVKPILASCIGVKEEELAKELIRPVENDSLVYIENWVKAN